MILNKTLGNVAVVLVLVAGFARPLSGAIVVTGQEVHAASGNVTANYAGDVAANDLIDTNSPTLASWSANVTPYFLTDSINNGVIISGKGTYLPATYSGGRLPATFTYYLNTNTNLAGYNLTAIHSFAGWFNSGAVLGNQEYELLVRLVGATNFNSLGVFQYSPFTGTNRNTTSATKLVLTNDSALYLATNVSAVQFVFMNPGTTNAVAAPDGTVYLEVDVLGAPAAISAAVLLAADISRAQSIHDAAVAGPAIGQYSSGALDTLQNAINQAQAVYDNPSATQNDLAVAKQNLDTAVLAFQKSVNGGLPVLHHILSTGQSLSIGWNGSPALTTSQPYGNLTLSVLPVGTEIQQVGTNLVPLVEGLNSWSNNVETISSALANTLTALSPQTNYASIVTRHGEASLAYAQLKKGTVWYSLGLQQISNAMTAAPALLKGYEVTAVTVVHGESDQQNGNGPYYAGYLRQWQHDYDADAKAITGQTNDVPMFLCQMSSWTMYNSATSLIPSAQLYATENYPNFFLVGPKYFLTYADGVHLTSASYRRLGEYYGKVMKKVLIDGQRWRPLTPDTISMSGTNITVTLHVPAPPIVIDKTAVITQSNDGFEYTDDSSSAAISGVTITSPNTLMVSLNHIPTGAHPRLRYAYTGVIGSWAGANQSGSARGNIRDSDATPSLYGDSLANWLVHFDDAIPFNATHPLQLSAMPPAPGNAGIITWPTVSGSYNFLDYATNLTPPVTWFNLYTINGNDAHLIYSPNSIYTTVNYTNYSQHAPCFFRVRVQ